MNTGITAVEETGLSVTPFLPREAGVSREHLCEIDPFSDSRWELFIAGHPRASVFHSTRWLRALQVTYGYEPVVLTTSVRGGVLTNGLVLCRVKSWLTGWRLVSLPFADHCDPLASNPDELSDLLLRVRQYDVGKWEYTEIRPTLYQPEHTGFEKSATYWTHNLDLSKSKHELFRNFHKTSIQGKIRKAEREGLRYEEGNSEILLAKFYRLLITTRRRHCIPPQPRSWFRALISTFGDDLKIRVVSKDDLPIASILTLSHGKSIVYKYGCSDARFHGFGGIALLLWKTIQEAKVGGAEVLDMGRSDCDNLGLISFKERLGAGRQPLFYWTYSNRPRRSLDVRGRTWLKKVVPATPDFVLEMAGTLLYRHIG
jgi:hypothetical protein